MKLQILSIRLVMAMANPLLESFGESLQSWLSVCVLTIWYFRPFSNAGLQSPRDQPNIRVSLVGEAPSLIAHNYFKRINPPWKNVSLSMYATDSLDSSWAFYYVQSRWMEWIKKAIWSHCFNVKQFSAEKSFDPKDLF